ncbi:MAG: molybdopterin converting factor subunit 1 [Bacteroidota bacterium]
MPSSTISVTIRLFASVKDLAKISETTIELPGASVADDVLLYLISRYPEMSGFRSYIRMAVNESYVDPGFTLHDGDEVAIIPPVSGG